jgi:hypothetical protein|tara:strand:+ start:871 stop:1062 length:192 start_codon:yes stop_codon:yes gene_type:complete
MSSNKFSSTCLNSNTLEGNCAAVGKAYGKLGSSLKAEDHLKFIQYKDIQKNVTIIDIFDTHPV